MSKAMIGILLDTCDVIREGKIKVENPCGHDLSQYPPDIEYCPRCGTSLYEKDDEVPIEGFNENEGTFWEFAVLDLEDEVIFGVEIKTDDEGVGYGMVNTQKLIDLLQEQSSIIMAGLKARLEPLELWNDRKFGLWMGEYE